MDGVEVLSRKRKRSEDFSRPAKRSNRRMTINCADGIRRNSYPKIVRANKSLSLVSPKKLEKFLPKTQTPIRTPRSGSLSRGSVNAKTSEVDQSAVKSTKKMLKSPSGKSSSKLPNTQVKSKIPTKISSSKVSRNLGISKKSISKVNRKPLLKKSILDRAVKPFSPSKRAVPLQTHSFVTKIPNAFNFASKTKPGAPPPRKASPKKEVNKSSIKKASPKNMKGNTSSANKVLSPKNKSTAKTPAKSINFSVKKSKPVRLSINKKRKPLNMSTEVKSSSNKKTSFSLNKSMPAKMSSPKRNQINKKMKPLNMSMEMKCSSIKRKPLSPNKSMLAKMSSSKKNEIKKRKPLNMSMEMKSSSFKTTTLSLNKSMPAKLLSSKNNQMVKLHSCNTTLLDSNDRSAINKSTVKTPVNQGRIKLEQTSIGKSSNRKMVSNAEAGGIEGNELSKEMKKMSYSSAVKRKPVNRVLQPQTSKAADLKPVSIPKNIMILVNKKPAFSNRHVNSPDPIIISRQTLKSLPNRSVKKDLRKAMKPNIAKLASNLSTRDNYVSSAVKTPKTPSETSQRNISRNKIEATGKTPIILKASASKSKPESSRSKRNSNVNERSSPDDLSTPSGVKIHHISMRNDSVLKSSMKQEHGAISCKKVNFDMSHLISKSSQGDNDLSISSDISNKKEIFNNSEEPSKYFLAALELSCDSFLDGTTIINSSLKKTRRSSIKSQLILPSSTPIQSTRQADWLVNTPSSRMLFLHPGHSECPTPGSSKKLEYSASNSISVSSEANDTNKLPPCGVYLSPLITADTLNISVENFVSPLTPAAFGLNLKNESRSSSSRARKSVTNSVSDSLEVLNSISKCSRQSLNRSKTLSAAKTSHPTKSPKNDLQDVRGVKEIFVHKSPKNDLRTNISGVKKLLKSQNSPKNDLRDVRGVKGLLSSPQKSPKNDLRDIRGVKRLLKSPQKSPKNDLRDVRGVKRLLSSPQKSPRNDLRDVRGVKQLMLSQKSPKNDLRDVRGVRRLLSSPQKSPKNDLRDVRGVKRLLSTQKGPKNDLRNVSGLKQLMATPSRTIAKIEKITPEHKQSSTNGVEEAAIEGIPENVQIKTEGKTHATKRKAEVPKEVPAKRKVKQEIDSPTITTTNEQDVPRRTRRNRKELINTESSDSTEKNHSTVRKTRSKLQDTTDAAGTTKAAASKRAKKIVPNEIESVVSGRKTAGARKSLTTSKLRTILRRRKSSGSGVLVVSAKKVQFNPHLRVRKISSNEDYNSPKCVKAETPKGKRKSKKSETSEKETSSVEKVMPSKGKRTTKETKVVSKSDEVKSTRVGKAAIAATSGEGTSSVAKDISSPLKGTRATRKNKTDSASSEAKPTRGKKNANSGKSSEGSSAVEKRSPLKEKRTKGATEAAPAKEVKMTRGRKVAKTDATVKAEKPVVKSSTVSRRKVATNKENEPLPKDSPSVPRRVLRKRN